MTAVYRKTPAGLDALRQRSHGLSLRERSVLILVNGELAAAELQARLGQDPAPMLAALRGHGLIEPVAGTAATVDVPIEPPATAPAPSDHAALAARALRVLTPLFGPGAAEIVAGLAQARDAAELRRALAQLEQKLAIYRGARDAAALVRRIATPEGG